NSHLWSIVDGQAEANVPNRSTIIEMVPKDEFWNSEWRNIEYEFDFTPLQGVDRNISFGVIDNSNWYEFHFLENSYELVRVENGSVPFRVNHPFRLENGKTYKMNIRLKDGNIQLLINDQLIIDQDDWSYNDGSIGKIGIKAGTGAIAPTRLRYDNIIVRSLDAPTQDGKQLEYTHFKQSDPVWKNDIYDTATEWSQVPTMNRWGCAVTSLAMIMHYHGLTTMPDGSPVTPAALNNWLTTQADGYVKDGLVNWIAGTRLTRLISEQYGTPKLEYRWSGDTTLTTVASEIAADKPSIIEIAGHFLTVNGVTGDGTDLYIKDPAYDYTKFSQHQTELLSSRLFQPSHTDLSYLFMAHQPGLKVTLMDANHQPVSNLESFTDYLQDPTGESSEKTDPTQIHQLAQPESGTYYLTVSQQEFGPYAFQFFAYDVAANPTALHHTGMVGPQPLTFTIRYERQGTSTIAHTMNFTQFRADLKLVKDQGHFWQKASYKVLDKMAAWGEASTSAKKQQHYARLLSVLVKAHRNLITTDGHTYLTQQVTALNETF
ncbi:MAG TPA: C39 family peptidase, partial [Patescibacteria group bacterium]